MEKKGVTWKKELSRTNGWVAEADFWQDRALQIFQCPDCGVVAMNVTQGHSGSPDSGVPKLFDAWLCKLGNAIAACVMLLSVS